MGYALGHSMTNEYTPGPWEVDDMRGHLLIWNPKIGGEDGTTVATTPQRKRKAHKVADRYCPTTDEDIANARLIAAAPDLLAALEDMLDWYSRDGGDCGAVGDQARAAIEKANA